MVAHHPTMVFSCVKHVTYTRGLDRSMTSSSMSQVTIEKMRATFATLGIPEMMKDNGTVFTSTEFSQFAKQNDIRHVTTSHTVSPYLNWTCKMSFKEGKKEVVRWIMETSYQYSCSNTDQLHSQQLECEPQN